MIKIKEGKIFKKEKKEERKKKRKRMKERSLLHGVF